MKYFTSIFLFFLLGSCRTIEGTYYEAFDPPGDGATYTFNKDGSFSYESRYDGGGEYGNGTYRICAGRARFVFDHAANTSYIASRYCLSAREYGEKQNRFYITVNDEHNVGMAGALIRYSFNDSAGAELYTDMDGYARIDYEGQNDSLFLKITFVPYLKQSGPYGKFEKRLSFSVHDSITVQLLPDPRWGQTPVDSGTVWRCGYRANDAKIYLTARWAEKVPKANYRLRRSTRKAERILVRQPS